MKMKRLLALAVVTLLVVCFFVSQEVHALALRGELGVAKTITQLNSKHHPFVRQVTHWLDTEEIPWYEIKEDDDNPVFRILAGSIKNNNDSVNEPVLHNKTTNCILLVGDKANEKPQIILHLLPSPTTLEECISPTLCRDMTHAYYDYSAAQKSENNQNDEVLPGSLIHLHQDVWNSKRDICSCRLLMRLGQTRIQRRIFARKTMARRIHAAIAIPFLQEHHLWSATKAKYYYGLFTKKEGEQELLVAVATFSSRRTVTRNGLPHKSHELIRFCTQRNGMVIGGLSKLIRAFITHHTPDDIVTVVDRDWGPAGSGWHSLGFETVHIMPPLSMAIGIADGGGVRRHLVGAGIVNLEEEESKKDAIISQHRLGLSVPLLDELDFIDHHDPDTARNCLARHGFFPVHDTGVERLLMIVSDSQRTSTPLQQRTASNHHDPVEAPSVTQTLWESSVPKYASVYYSENSGITALLQDANKRSKMRDTSTQLTTIAESTKIDEKYVSSWHATSGSQSFLSAKTVFSAPSSLDSKATIEVQERVGGWHTVSAIGGSRKSIYHGVYQVNPQDGIIDPCAIGPSEYLRTMASLALSAMGQQHEGRYLDRNKNHYRDLDDKASQRPLRFLHFGFGAGTLMRMLGHYIPNSEHVSIELDSAVVRAAKELQLVDSPNKNQRIELGDALLYRQNGNTQRGKDSYSNDEEEKPFDFILVDIFNEDNILPREFYSIQFLEGLRDNILSPLSGIVIHNFHSGHKALAMQIEEAKNAYSNVFKNENSCCIVESLDTKKNGGNTIIMASKEPFYLDCNRNKYSNNVGMHLEESAVKAQQRWGVHFDVPSRVKQAQFF